VQHGVADCGWGASQSFLSQDERVHDCRIISFERLWDPPVGGVDGDVVYIHLFPDESYSGVSGLVREVVWISGEELVRGAQITLVIRN